MSTLGEASVRAIVLAGSYPASQAFAGGPLIGPLTPVAQRPLISYVLRWLRDGRIQHAAVCLNDATRHVRGALRSDAGLSPELEYFHDDAPRGPAGCVRDAGLVLPGRTFVVAEGAQIPTVDLQELLRSHHRSGAALTIALDQDRRQLMGGQRPPSPAGLYVFDRRAFDLIAASGFQDIKEGLVPRLYEAGECINLHVVPGVSVRIHDVESYLAVNEWMVQRLAAMPAAARAEPRPVGAAGVRIVGPVVFGPGVRVMPGATIVGPTSIGAGSTIGSGALVSRSAVWAGCTIGDGAVVDRGLLTEGAVVEPGAWLFNVVRMSRSRDRNRSGWLRRFVRRSADEPRRIPGLPQTVAVRREA
jgi:mannose-1-phosphate guanylyltransferase